MTSSSDPERTRRIREAIDQALRAREREVRDALQAALRGAADSGLARLAEPLDLPDEVLAPPAPETHLFDSLLLDLHDAVDQLASAADQAAILDRLIEGASRFAGRAALFVIRKDQAVGWKAAGFGAMPAGTTDIRQQTLSATGNSALARAVATAQRVEDTEPEAADLVWGAFDAAPADAYSALPVSVRGRVVAVLWADAGEGRGPVRVGALATLCRVAEGALEIQAQRGRPAAPRPASVERRPSEAWQAPGEAARRPAPPAVERIPPPGAPAQPAAAPPAAPAPSGEEAHEEARRFARLLVSEVLLYNGPQVEEGRRQRDLFRRLREDLERSEQMYRQRVSPEVIASTDYFREEVVRTLANGDPDLLGSR